MAGGVSRKKKVGGGGGGGGGGVKEGENMAGDYDSQKVDCILGKYAKMQFVIRLSHLHEYRV